MQLENYGALRLVGRNGLISYLRKHVQDPRRKQGTRFPAHPMIIACALAVLAGASTFAGIWHWISTREKNFMVGLGFFRRYRMSEPAIRRLLNRVNPDEVEKALSEWLSAQRPGGMAGKAIAVDGKTLRASRSGNIPAVHLISAVLHDTGVTIAQKRVASKSNEITAVNPLLRDLNIEGSVISLDAIHTQDETARFIVKEKKADYLMTVKENRKNLRDDIINTMDLKKKSSNLHTNR